MPANPALKTGVFNPAASVFVSASAGTGKTRLLVNRVLVLLLSGVAPSKILCLTFTRAAAAEMQERILRTLGEWVMMEEKALAAALTPLLERAPEAAILARARALFAAVLESPEGVRIQTIHGFSQSLLKRFPVEAGINPHFAVMDERTEQETLAEVRLRLWNRAQSGDPELQNAIRALGAGMSETTLQDLLTVIVKRKRDFRDLLHLTGGAPAAVALLWKRLGAEPGMTLEALADKHFTYDEATLALLRGLAQKLMGGGANAVKTGAGMASWLALAPSARAEQARVYAKLFLTAEGEKKLPKSLCAKGDAGDDLEHLCAEQERVWNFHLAWKALQTAERTTHMLHIAEALLSLYEAHKRARARMDYDDLILAGRDLLTRPGISPWVLFKLDGGIDHVLVDEAQDTSPSQWAIIGALTDDFFAGAGQRDADRSLFVVGDEKQSIFSFQGADVQALATMRRYFTRRIEEAGGHAHHHILTESYRSAPEVLHAVDAVFARPEARSGLTFEEGELSHKPTRPGPGLAELWPLVHADENDPRPPAVHLSRLLAATIRGWIDSGQASAGDIMILVRTRTNFVDRLSRALKRRDIPVAGIDRMVLSDNLAVQDLMALGQVLLLPEDDLSLAAVLKSPIGNIDEDTLFALAHGRGDQSLWEVLSSRAQSRDLAPDEDPSTPLRSAQDGSIRKAYELLSDLRGRVDYLAPYELYSYLLDTRGVRRRFTGRMGSEYQDPIDEFLSQALLFEQGHTPGLQGFLHWLMSSQSEIKRDMEQAQGCVRIMTVHGAKGLQAPIVILPDTIGVPSLKETMLWHEDGNVSLPLMLQSEKEDDLLCRALRRACKDAMMAEYRRLLYVALTRAEDRLYVCGATSHAQAGEQSWYALVRDGIADITAPFDMPTGEGLRVGTWPLPGRTRPPTAETAAVRETFDHLLHPVPQEPAPSRPLTPSRLAGDEPPAASPVRDAGIYRRGTLIHTLLQYLPDIAPDARGQAAARLARDPQIGDSARAECIREALSVMNDPRFAFLFGPDSLAEVPVAGTVTVAGKPVAVAGQIDRLHIGEEEVWIVDYKTNRQPPANPADIPSVYRRQLLLYRLLLSAIYPGRRIRAALLWTAMARIDEIPEALLDERDLSTYI